MENLVDASLAGVGFGIICFLLMAFAKGVGIIDNKWEGIIELCVNVAAGFVCGYWIHTC